MRSALHEASPMKPKALNRASGLFVVVALVAALSAPAHLFAYADDSANAAEAPQTSKQVDDREDAALSEQSDQEEPEKEGKLGIAEAVRTASESSGMLDNDARDIPVTSAIALGLAAFALLAIAFKLKA